MIVEVTNNQNTQQSGSTRSDSNAVDRESVKFCLRRELEFGGR